MFAPAQALVQQDLVDAAALHRDTLLLMQVGGQSVERPGGKRQPERLWLGQCTRNHGGGLLRRIGGRASGAMPILEGLHSLCIEAVDAPPHRLDIKAQARGNGGCALPVTGTPDDLSPLHHLSRSGARVGQRLDCRTLLNHQFP